VWRQYYTDTQVFEEPFEAKYEYDSNGNVTKITDIDGRVTSYAYNSNNDVTSITMGSTATATTATVF